MGSRMGPNYACLFVGYMVGRIFSTYRGLIPQLYKRYIDDIIGTASCRQDELESFIMHALPLSIPLCSSLTQFLKVRYLSWTSHSASQAAELVLPFTTNTPTSTSIYITPLLNLSTAKTVFPSPSSCTFAVFAPKMMTSCRNARRCPPFFKSRGYLSDLLQNAWERVSYVTRQEALEKRVRENEGRIPLVLTCHPLTSRVKHIVLNNFNILTTDPTTATIFPAPPVAAHRRDLSLRDVLIHTFDRSQTEEPGTFACRHPRCRTSLYTSSNVHVC